MIVLNVTYKCKPGRNQALLERLRAEGIDAASRADEGNLQYAYYLPTDGSDELLLIEKWRDAQALKAHSTQPHLKKLMEFKAEYADDTVIEKFEI